MTAHESGTAPSPACVKFVAAWGLVLALKVLIAAWLPLFGDEAFYAWEALHPAWAYSDLPGGTAFLIALGTGASGDHWLGVRLPFLLLGAALPWLVVRMASRIGSVEQAWRAGLWSLPLPLLLPLGTLALPDALLVFATLLALDAVLGLQCRSATRRFDPLHLQLALALAAGALSHYRFAPVLAVGAAALLLFADRRLLRAPGLWLALGAGALAWLPLVLWNLDAGAAGLRFHLLERHPWSFEARGLAQPVAQALITTPVLYALLLIALIHGWKRGGAARLLAACGVGLALFYAVLAPFADQARFSLHWPLPAYLVAAALLPAWLDDGQGRAKRWLARAAAALAVFGSLLVAVAFAVPAVPSVAARTAGTELYPDNFLGWTEVADALRPRLGNGDAVVADHFMLAAQLSFALDRRRQVFVLDHWNNHKHGRAAQLALWGYDETGLDALPAGTPAWLLFEIGETPERELAGWVARGCRWFEAMAPIAAVDGPGGGKTFWIYRGLRRAGPAPAECPTLPPPGGG